MKETIIIENLEIKASVGVYEKEKKTKQKIIINCEILLKGHKPPYLDELREVTDYGQFRRIVLDTIEKKQSINNFQFNPLLLKSIQQQNEFSSRCNIPAN